MMTWYSRKHWVCTG